MEGMNGTALAIGWVVPAATCGTRRLELPLVGGMFIGTRMHTRGHDLVYTSIRRLPFRCAGPSDVVPW